MCCIYKPRCASVYLLACCQPSSFSPWLQVIAAHCQECCKLETAQQKSNVLHLQNQVRQRVPSGVLLRALSAILFVSLAAGYNSSLSGMLQVGDCPAEEQCAASTKPDALACTFWRAVACLVSLPLFLPGCRLIQLIVRNVASWRLPSRRAMCCIYKTRCTSVYLQACCQPSSFSPWLQVITAHCQECCKLETAQQKSNVLHLQNQMR